MMKTVDLIDAIDGASKQRSKDVKTGTRIETPEEIMSYAEGWSRGYYAGIVTALASCILIWAIYLFC